MHMYIYIYLNLWFLHFSTYVYRDDIFIYVCLCIYFCLFCGFTSHIHVLLLCISHDASHRTDGPGTPPHVDSIRGVFFGTGGTGGDKSEVCSKVADLSPRNVRKQAATVVVVVDINIGETRLGGLIQGLTSTTLLSSVYPYAWRCFWLLLGCNP